MTQVPHSSQKVPKLRFREFQCEWEEKKIGEVFNIFNGFAFASTDSVNEGILWVKIADVGIQEMKKDALSYLPYDFGEKYKKFILNEGDYVVALTRPILSGRLKIAKVDKYFNNSLLNQRVGKIQSQNNLTFIYFLLQKAEIIYAIEKTIGGSDPPNLSPSEINPISVNIPTIPEQQKIASFLSSVVTRIEQLQEKKFLLEEYKKGVMQKIFAREIRFKDENGKEYGEWKEKKLGDLCKIKTGKKDVNEGNPEGKYPFFTCAKTHTYSDLYSFDCDAILIAGNGEVGHCQRYSGKFEAYQRTYVLSDFSEDIDYLYCHLNSTFQDVISSQKQMGAMPYIKLGMLTDFMIPIPSLPEQQKIASFLSEIDSKIQSTTEQLEEAEKWKKGLLQGMFV